MEKIEIFLTSTQIDILHEMVDYDALKKKHPNVSNQDMIQNIVDNYLRKMADANLDDKWKTLSSDEKKEKLKI